MEDLLKLVQAAAIARRECIKLVWDYGTYGTHCGCQSTFDHHMWSIHVEKAGGNAGCPDWSELDTDLTVLLQKYLIDRRGRGLGDPFPESDSTEDVKKRLAEYFEQKELTTAHREIVETIKAALNDKLEQLQQSLADINKLLR